MYIIFYIKNVNTLVVLWGGFKSIQLKSTVRQFSKFLEQRFRLSPSVLVIREGLVYHWDIHNHLQKASDPQDTGDK